MTIETQFAPQDEVYSIYPNLQNVGDKCPVCHGSGKYKPPGATGAPWACEECDGTGTVVVDTKTLWAVRGPHLIDRVVTETATPTGADTVITYALLGVDFLTVEGDTFATEAEAEAEAAVRNA